MLYLFLCTRYCGSSSVILKGRHHLQMVQLAKSLALRGPGLVGKQRLLD